MRNQGIGYGDAREETQKRATVFTCPHWPGQTKRSVVKRTFRPFLFEQDLFLDDHWLSRPTINLTSAPVVLQYDPGEESKQAEGTRPCCCILTTIPPLHFISDHYIRTSWRLFAMVSVKLHGLGLALPGALMGSNVRKIQCAGSIDSYISL